MKIKVIDLLNKIANGEEVPKKIKYEKDTYIHIDNYCYYCEDTNLILSDRIFVEYSKLNDEVEIIEEPKKIKKIEMYQDEEGHYFLNNRDKKIYIRCDEIDFMVDKFNELIDEINNLKEK